MTGRTYLVGGGRVARAFVGTTNGWATTAEDFTAEEVAAHVDDIESLDGWTIPDSLADDFRALGRALRAVDGRPTETT